MYIMFFEIPKTKKITTPLLLRYCKTINRNLTLFCRILKKTEKCLKFTPNGSKIRCLNVAIFILIG